MSGGDAAFLEYLTGGVTDEGIQGNQMNQYNLALAGAYPNLSAYAKPYLAKAAKDAFAQFRFNQPGANFLPWYVGKGNSFF